jgi:hypothetical protein
MRGRYRADVSIKRWQRRTSHFHFRQQHTVFLCAVEGLVAALLCEFGAGRWRDGSSSPGNFDGIALEFYKSQADRFVGYGVQYLLGSSEPLMLQFSFDETSRRMTGATILFGMQDGPTAASTAALRDKMLAMALEARHPLEFEWEYEFTLADGKWA